MQARTRVPWALTHPQHGLLCNTLQSHQVASAQCFKSQDPTYQIQHCWDEKQSSTMGDSKGWAEFLEALQWLLCKSPCKAVFWGLHILGQGMIHPICRAVTQPEDGYTLSYLTHMHTQRTTRGRSAFIHTSQKKGCKTKLLSTLQGRWTLGLSRLNFQRSSGDLSCFSFTQKQPRKATTHAEWGCHLTRKYQQSQEQLSVPWH